jgi:hypothetical protein
LGLKRGYEGGFCGKKGRVYMLIFPPKNNNFIGSSSPKEKKQNCQNIPARRTQVIGGGAKKKTLLFGPWLQQRQKVKLIVLLGNLGDKLFLFYLVNIHIRSNFFFLILLLF